MTLDLDREIRAAIGDILDLADPSFPTSPARPRHDTHETQHSWPSRLAVAAAAVALVLAGLFAIHRHDPSPRSGSATSSSPGTSPSTTTMPSTSSAPPTSETVWWRDLAQLPDNLATIPLPRPGTITLRAVDGRPILVRRTSDSLCILEGPSGGGGCLQITPGASSAGFQHGESTGVLANGTVLPRFIYWLTSNAVTVSFVDVHGASACVEGPQPVSAYPGVTLWTCTSDGSTPRGQTKSIYRVNNVNYVASVH